MIPEFGATSELTALLRDCQIGCCASTFAHFANSPPQRLALLTGHAYAVVRTFVASRALLLRCCVTGLARP